MIQAVQPLPGRRRKRSMSSAPLEAAVSRDAGGCFEEFVRGRSAHLFELTLLLTGQNQAEAEDLIQIAPERAYRRRASLSRDRDPEPYVRKALVNASIDRWRALRRHAEQRVQAADCGPAVDDRTSERANRHLLLRSLAGETAPRAAPRGAGEFAGLGPGLTTLVRQSRMHTHLIFAGGRATGCRSVCSSPPCRALYVPRLGQVVVGWHVAGSRGHTLAAWWGRP